MSLIHFPCSKTSCYTAGGELIHLTAHILLLYVVHIYTSVSIYTHINVWHTFTWDTVLQISRHSLEVHKLVKLHTGLCLCVLCHSSSLSSSAIISCLFPDSWNVLSDQISNPWKLLSFSCFHHTLLLQKHCLTLCTEHYNRITILENFKL